MRVFVTSNEMWGEVKRDLKEMGIKYISQTVQDQEGEFPTLEINNYGYTLLDPDLDEVRNTAMDAGLNLTWIIAEGNDRFANDVSPLNPNPAHLEHINFWKQFLRDGCFSYTYPERLSPQWDRVIHELKTRPNTRQAVITMYDWHQDLMNFGGRDRIPCSMYYQYIIRDDKLHCSYTMRSCDLIKFFLADVAIAIDMQHQLAEHLGVNMGSFTHFIGSLHAFESDLQGVF